MQNNKKITIYDVATEANVSLATVSRVINGSSVVKPKTRERVLEAIKKLDFKPNQVARGLATSKTTTVAIVFPQDMFSHIRSMMSGIGDAARILNYNICMYTTNDLGEGVATIQNIIEKVIQSRADGVILFNNEYIKEEVELLIKYNVPFVVIGSKHEGEHSASIYVDTEALGYDIVNEYVNKGKSKILTLIQDTILLDNDLLVAGIKKACVDHNVAINDNDIVKVSDNYEECFEELEALMSNGGIKHDLIITNYDKVAVAALNVCTDHGHSIPDDVEIVGMQDTTYATMSRPSISSYHMPVYDMGAMAVRLLTKVLNNEEIETKTVCVQSHFIKRNSTK